SVPKTRYPLTPTLSPPGRGSNSRRENEILFPSPPRRGEGKTKNKKDMLMPTWRNKPPNDHNFNKHSTAEARAALADAAQLATARLYADVLELWTICRRKKCRRHQRCAGEVMACLRRNMPTVAEHNHEALMGGPRRQNAYPTCQSRRMGDAAH